MGSVLASDLLETRLLLCTKVKTPLRWLLPRQRKMKISWRSRREQRQGHCIDNKLHQDACTIRGIDLEVENCAPGASATRTLCPALCIRIVELWRRTQHPLHESLVGRSGNVKAPNMRDNLHADLEMSQHVQQSLQKVPPPEVAAANDEQVAKVGHARLAAVQLAAWESAQKQQCQKLLHSSYQFCRHRIKRRIAIVVAMPVEQQGFPRANQ